MIEIVLSYTLISFITISPVPRVVPVGELVQRRGSLVKQFLQNQFRLLDAQTNSALSGKALYQPRSVKELAANRYSNILPLESTRVRLLHNNESAYINANYLGNSTADEKQQTNRYLYIATQAPLPHTMDQFWQMIWQEQSVLIVMLANLIKYAGGDRSRPQCKANRYWPLSSDPDLSQRSQPAHVPLHRQVAVQSCRGE